MLNIIREEEFDNHKIVSFVGDKKFGFHGFIALHRGNMQAPAFGATRIWNYTSDEEALRDVLRLSKLMTKKLLLADCYYGGAKAVLILDSHREVDRKELLTAYAQIINCYRGGLITGADVGVNQEDLLQLSQTTKFVMGIHSDPVSSTIQGVYACFSPCLQERFGNDSFDGRSVAIQGLGKIGYGLLELFVTSNTKIFACDLNPVVLKKVKELYPQVAIVSPEDIHKQEVDIFVPCALSNAITKSNVDELHCQIILGSANCQLDNDETAELLFKRNILYAPDYIVNAGGVISVVDEYENGSASDERVSKKIQTMVKTLKQIIEESKKRHCSTLTIADEIAQERMSKI